MDNSAQALLPDTEEKSSRFRWLVGTLIALFIMAPVGIFAWRYLYNPCEVDAVKEASTFLVTQLKSYDHLYQVASTASRTYLDPPVLVMQQIHLDTQEVAVPACLQTAKNELISYMATVIRAFRAWESGEDDVAIRDMISQSDNYYDHFYDELEAVNKCAPYCFP